MGSCISCTDRNDDGDIPETRMMEPVQPSVPKIDYGIENCPLYVCKHDYESRTDDDLGFKRGDLMYIIKADDDGWWLAHSKDSGRKGYIPSNYVVENKGLDKELWYYGNLNCAKAEKLLMKKCNGIGSFLVRDSETTCDDFVLSVRSVEEIVHYLIKYEWLNTASYSITPQVSFASLVDLVAYFHQPSDILCTVLSSPCIMAEKPPTSGLSKQVNKEWHIDRKGIQFTKKLGAGFFTDVWEGLWNKKMPIAIKVLRNPKSVHQSELLAEADIIRKFYHSNLTQFYAVCSEGDPLYMISELMEHGSLLEFLHDDRGKSLTHLNLIDMAAQVACGMAYLEEKDYVHRELAAKNVLVGENLICKVTDFGFSRLIVEDDYETIFRFPIKWTAPEAALYNRYSMRSDVWSFGIVLYEIITYGRIPYPGMVSRGILEAVFEGTYRMDCPPNCPTKLHNIMLDCWQQEPDNRPSFETLQLQLEEFFTTDDSEPKEPA